MLSPRYSVATALDWSYGGVNSSIPGNGGPDCASFISLERRFLETILACTLAIFYTLWGWKCIAFPSALPFVRKDRGGKRLLLVVVSLVFGAEIGFKLATKQLIYLLNPCHVTTALQIYLLAAPPSRFLTMLFRMHLNYLNGAVLAILFPVTNTRLLPLEVEIYWLQHILMLVTPYYLLRLGGVYTIEDLRDMSWSCFSAGLTFFYHFLVLQPFAILSEVNLNNILCPAVSDPFYGPNYRLAAMVHQSLCIPFVAKTFCAIATFFLTVFPPTKVKDNLGADVTMSTYNRHFKKHYYENNNNASKSASNSLGHHKRSLSDAVPCHTATCLPSATYPQHMSNWLTLSSIRLRRIDATADTDDSISPESVSTEFVTESRDTAITSGAFSERDRCTVSGEDEGMCSCEEDLFCKSSLHREAAVNVQENCY